MQNTKLFKPILLATYLLLLITLLISCNNDDDNNNATPEQQLPAITQTGRNTFGCLIDGKLFYPRDGIGGIFGTANAVSWIGSGNNTYNELSVHNYQDGKPINNFILHLQTPSGDLVTEYIWQESNFQDGIDSPEYTHLYIRAFDEASGGFKWYGSFENSGSVIITRRNGGIVSGVFSGTLREAGGADEVEITLGRFDIDTFTISNHPFP